MPRFTAACLGLLLPALPLMATAQTTDQPAAAAPAPGQPTEAPQPAAPHPAQPQAEPAQPVQPQQQPQAAPASPAPVQPQQAPDAAQTQPATPAQPSPPAQPELPPAGRQTLAQGSAFRTLGQDVKGPSGVVVAQLVNVLVNADAQPVAAILDYGGFLGVGKRRIAVAWQALRFGSEGITLNLSREQLRGIPEFKEGEPVVIAVAPAGSGTAEAPANR
jgi:hypothetical protein